MAKSYRVPLIISGLVFGTLGGMQACGSFAPSRYVEEAKLATLSDGTTVLVTLLNVSEWRGDVSRRFEVLDPVTGDTIRRLAPWIFQGLGGLRWLGGSGSREWWSRDSEILLLDWATGQRLATHSDILAKNPVLRGKFARVGYEYRIDPASAALIGLGGDGEPYAVDRQTLQASPYRGKLPHYQHAPSFSGNRVGLEEVPFGREDGSLVITSYTVDGDGPHTALWREPSGKVRWTLSEEDFHGEDVKGVNAVDSNTLYLRVSNDSLLGEMFGGEYVYAVEIESGRIRWHRKL